MGTPLLRRTIHALTTSAAVAGVVRGSAAFSPVVRRFVAGETLDDALSVTGDLEKEGFLVALDYLGENTTTVLEVESATHAALEALDGIARGECRAYLSVKLTQLGLDLGEHVVLGAMRRVLGRAQEHGVFVRVDMEGSSYTARTLELFDLLFRDYAGVGIVLQAYLYRSEADLRRLVPQGVQVRLVKGAYAEPPHLAFRRKRDTDRNYLRLLEYLLKHGTSPAIATHDPRMIDAAVRLAAQAGRPAADFEFQMLYGVRRDLQQALIRDGYTVRIYLPYGEEWYPYLTRRLAERPANLLFMAGTVVRERRAGTGRTERRSGTMGPHSDTTRCR